MHTESCCNRCIPRRGNPLPNVSAAKQYPFPPARSGGDTDRDITLLPFVISYMQMICQRQKRCLNYCLSTLLTPEALLGSSGCWMFIQQSKISYCQQVGTSMIYVISMADHRTCWKLHEIMAHSITLVISMLMAMLTLVIWNSSCSQYILRARDIRTFTS